MVDATLAGATNAAVCKLCEAGTYGSGFGEWMYMSSSKKELLVGGILCSSDGLDGCVRAVIQPDSIRRYHGL